jgi:predicted AlkP superfamily phosphohydrolase/phosphomutase
MRKLFWTSWLVAAAAALAPVPAAAGAAPRNIILVGWDGAQRAHVKEALGRGELPTLKTLSQEGGLVDIDVITGATDTKAGWTQILTGYHPAVTGVYSNGRFQDVPKGLSLFERLKGHFGSDQFVCAAVIGKSAHCGEIRAPFKKRLDEAAKADNAGTGKKQPKQPGAGQQPQGTIVEENGVKYRLFKGSPYYTMHGSCDVWDYGLVQDQKVGTRAIELLDTYKDKPFFFFVHFAQVDHSGHQHGENSKQYNDALISNDKWTGRIIDKVKALGLYEKTILYVTADHGFNEGAKGHRYAPYVFLGTNDPTVKRAGMRQDIAPTILSRFGLDLRTFQPNLDGETLTAPAAKPVQKAPESRPAGAKGGKAGKGGGKKAGADKAAA